MRVPWGTSCHTRGWRPGYLILLFARHLAAALSCQRVLDPFFFAGLQVKGVMFHFPDDVFLLYLALETAKRVLEGFALLKSDFSQSNYTPLLALNGPFCYDNLSVPKSSRMCSRPGSSVKTGT